ncbi:DUF4259 domain-containing protein [Salininema proteolyticum]|uniref:DUF4259 domain-containing protein n=1 Tax=Salininema proteolyticum TaxID=1607685 RepID=A0ABV8U1C3_9ACTN
MPTWSDGVFDGDGASDVLGTLRGEEAEQIEVAMEEAFEYVLEEERIAVYEVQEALALATVLAAKVDPDGADRRARREADYLDVMPTRDIRLLAAQAVRRILVPKGNDWYEYWGEQTPLDAIRLLAVRLDPGENA